MTTWLPAYNTVRIFLDGMLTMMLMYALLSYIQQRKAIYWQYALYIGCMLITFRLDDSDYGLASYAPGGNYAVALIESVAFILYIRFAILLIDIPRYDPFSHQILRYMTVLLAGGLLLDTILWVSGMSEAHCTLSTVLCWQVWPWWLCPVCFGFENRLFPILLPVHLSSSLAVWQHFVSILFPLFLSATPTIHSRFPSAICR
ncbi:MAG: hypothetical protein LH609_06765 [Rudanella sp.]|nr:hypothetical protein [Rudanella sp.]